MFWIIDKQFDHMIFVCKHLITAGHMRPLLFTHTVWFITNFKLTLKKWYQNKINVNFVKVWFI
jgi:hypothetical protein